MDTNKHEHSGARVCDPQQLRIACSFHAAAAHRAALRFESRQFL